jgi:uncharacterized SAM-binding protein YcdF (DUF218 family)
MDRTRAQRLARDLAAGAILGALTFLAVHALGLQTITRWGGFQFFWILIPLGAVLYVTPFRPLLWIAAGVLAALVAIVGYTPLVERPAQSLIRADSLQPVDAVVVLASGVNDDALLDPVGLDRLLTGIAIARDQRTRGDTLLLPLVVTRVTQRHAPYRSSDSDQRRILALAGPELNVHVTERVVNTRDEARKVAALARAQEWDTVAVVTSPSHTRRACAAFERVNLNVICVPARSRDLAMNTLRSPGDRLRAFQLWFYESIGTVYYKLRGWL